MAALVLQGADGRFEVNGQIEHVAGPVHVRLYGAESPFTASTTSNSHGHFRFRSLQPGTYVVSAFIRRHGEARQTVVVTPSLADDKGVVQVSIPLPPPTSTMERMRRRASVSVNQLAIPDAARRKAAEADKDLSKRDIERATQHLKEAVEIAPKYAEAWNSLGVIAYQTQNFTQAEQYFRKAHEADPASWGPTVNLGGVLLNLNRPQEALDFNRAVVEAHPNDALANSQLGMNYFLLGQWDKAQQYLTAAERLDASHFSHPQLLLAEIYARRGDRSSAVREMRDFLRRFPDSPIAGELQKKVQALEK